MNRISVILAVLCSVWFTSCTREGEDIIIPDENGAISLMDGSIIFSSRPHVTITSPNVFPEGVATFSTARSRMGIKSTGADEPTHNLRGNDYCFKLVKQVSTWEVDGVEVQATHVVLSDDNHAFVSYNEKGDPHRGGVVVYKYKINEGSLQDVTVDVEPIDYMFMKRGELSALDYHNGKLYMTGATSDRNFGYRYQTDGYNYAFFMVMELDEFKKFKRVEPKTVVKLSSFQGTSIRVHNGLIYITTGDGTNGTDGGIYIYDANNYNKVNAITGRDYDHARSVDVDDSGIYLMQAENARVTKFNLDGSGKNEIYNVAGEALQKDAKSDILVWDKYVFVCENESGLRMLYKENGMVNESLDAPGADVDTEVTNSVSMNSDVKKDLNGKDIQSNLLLLANGERGIYWYDIMKDNDGKDWIVANSNNSTLAETGSANFVTSKGNIVFVADGLGGLKVLYIGFNAGDTPPPVAGDGCQDFMSYLYDGTDQVSMLFPEMYSVFRPNAHPIIKQLFQLPTVEEAANVALNYIEITKETALYITYMSEGAGWNNSLGYFEIPADVAKTDKAEYDYWNTKIKPDMCTVVPNFFYSVNVLKDKYIIFKNIKDKSKGGNMVAGNTYRIGGDSKTFKAGTRVVLFMCPSGWNAQSSRVEVNFIPGYTNQIFFMHKGFNKETKIPYSIAYGKFAGVQMNSFYAADCNSMALCIEDWHMNGTDVDFNDIIFSVSDNLIHEKVTSFAAPKWAVGERVDNNTGLVIVPTEDILNK